MESESWKPVVGFEGLYEVSDLGRVRSLDRKVLHKGKPSFRAGSVLKPWISTNGYARVHLSGRTFAVHRLVLGAFTGDPPKDRPFGNHIDSNRLNNSLHNLEYCSARENTAHARQHGRLCMARGRKALLSPEDVRKIRRELGPNPMSCTAHKALGARYGVSAGTIRNVMVSPAWAHIT